MLKIFVQLTKLISLRRRISIIFFLLLTFVSSFFDAISIGLIIPYVSLFLDYEKAVLFLSKFNFLNISLVEPNIYYLVTYTFIFVIILSTLLKIFQSYLGTKLSDMLKYEILSGFYLKLVNLKYLDYDYINENDVNSNIFKITEVNNFISAYLSFVTHLLNIILISTLLIIIDLKVFIFLLILGIVLVAFNQLFKNLLLNNGQLISDNTDRRSTMLNNTVGYLPFIIINNLKNFFYKQYTKIELSIARSNIIITLVKKIPNLIFITFVTIVLAFIVLYLKMNLSDELFVAQISIFTGILFAILKALPQLTNLQSSISSIRGSINQTKDVLNFLNRIKSHHYKIEYKQNIKSINKIEFNNVDYKYSTSENKKEVIKNLNFTINKGDKIFIYGSSGSGKTTILKLILGLLRPSKGKVLIDDIEIKYNKYASINKKISYVPQDIFLSNATFLENLALGFKSNQIKMNEIMNAAKISRIHNFINDNKKKYNAKISHNARNISGGQKQRIGIARAILRNPEIIVLDEATSSMDAKNELLVLKNIISKFEGKTIICVSHNKQISKYFGKKYYLKNKKLSKW